MSWTIDDGVVRRPRSVLREVEEEPAESTARYVDTEEWIRVRTRLLLALDRFPEAKAAVTAALTEDDDDKAPDD